MPSKKKSSRAPSGKTRKPSGQLSVPAQPRKHTRRSKGSPLLEKRDDIDNIGKNREVLKKSIPALKSTTGAKPLSGRQRRNQESKKSIPAVKPTTGAKPAPGRQRRNQKPITPSSSDRPIPSIEAARVATLEGLGVRSGLTTLSPSVLGSEDISDRESLEPETVPWLLDPPDADLIFLRRSGYVAPLSDEALAAIHIVLGKEAAIRMASIRSDNTLFRTTIKYDRNVSPEDKTWDDPEIANLEAYELRQRADEPLVANFLDNLWLADLKFCRNQQEAIFQRTVMMAMINRHQLIFTPSGTSTQPTESALMFSVEATWTCPPMPTKRFKEKVGANPEDPGPFTTPPKPDLCVSFYRPKIIARGPWTHMRTETKQLVCYEGQGDSEADRAFGFFFVEAKRSRLEATDEAALYQVLNDASQALHNLHEFFKEAGTEGAFFDRVRVFSATASQKGVILRIHRAVKLEEDDEDRIVPAYPLHFEHQTFKSFRTEQFDRLKVVEAFERIMIGYGERQLLELLQEAAAIITRKVMDAWRDTKNPNSQHHNDYRYGQWGKPGRGSKQNTPASNRGRSLSMMSTSMAPPERAVAQESGASGRPNKRLRIGE